MRNPTQVILISGAPGVGKTEVARAVAKRIAPSMGVDLDDLAWVQPWVVDDRLHALMATNLRSWLAAAREAGATRLVVSGVVDPDGILQRLRPMLDDAAYEWRTFALRATPATLRERIGGDHKGQDPATRLGWAHLDERIAGVRGMRSIATDGRSIDDVADEVVMLAGAAVDDVDQVRTASRPRTPDGDEAADALGSLPVPAEVARAICVERLRSAGLARDAESIADELTMNSRLGYASHGVLRLPEYLADLASGVVLANAEPIVETVAAPWARAIDGASALGLLVKRAASQTLQELVAVHGIAVVGVRHGHHLGRLSTLADDVARTGAVTIGFANYSGGGQKVIPWGGMEPRIATNPLVLGFPSATRSIVFDSCSSSTSEGAVRLQRLRGEPVPVGQLRRLDGTATTDAASLYDGSAGIMPLGGEDAGHKGFGLAVLVELVAGVLSRGGVSTGPLDGGGGNSAVFMSIDPVRLGAGREQVEHEVAAFRDYMVSGEGGRVRLPGDRAATVDDVWLPRALVESTAAGRAHLRGRGDAAVDERG